MFTPDQADTLTMNDVTDYLGPALPVFHRFVDNGQRMGQAFFNSLSRFDQETLSTTAWDPFYRDTKDDVILALAFLLYTR